MTKQKWLNITIVFLAVGALALGAFAVNRANAPSARGSTHFGSIATNGTLAVVGAADAEQVTVTGYTTQTNSVFVLQQSDGTDKLTVSNAGALMAADNVDVRGNILDGGGEVNILGYGQVTGNTDNDQWTITGYTTQTNDLLVLEASGGADQFTVDNAGAAWVNGGLDLDGSTLTWDADGDTTAVASSDDVITYTIGVADGYVVIETGNLKVGDGSPSLTLNGEDVYIAGTFEADGGGRFDNSVTIGVGDFTIANGGFYPTFTDALVYDGDTITPTAYARSISTAGNITFTLGASCTDGQPLVVAIGDNFDVIINATNLRTTDGNALTLNQYDTAGFICQSNEWLLLYESNNQ